jgi:hypothetical protein
MNLLIRSGTLPFDVTLSLSSLFPENNVKLKTFQTLVL